MKKSILSGGLFLLSSLVFSCCGNNTSDFCMKKGDSGVGEVTSCTTKERSGADEKGPYKEATVTPCDRPDCPQKKK